MTKHQVWYLRGVGTSKFVIMCLVKSIMFVIICVVKNAKFVLMCVMETSTFVIMCVVENINVCHFVCGRKHRRLSLFVLWKHQRLSLCVG